MSQEYEKMSGKGSRNDKQARIKEEALDGISQLNCFILIFNLCLIFYSLLQKANEDFGSRQRQRLIPSYGVLNIRCFKIFAIF